MAQGGLPAQKQQSSFWASCTPFCASVARQRRPIRRSLREKCFFATYMAQATLSCPSDNSPCAAAKNRFQLFSRHGRETLRGFSFGNKTPCACGTRGFVYNLVESFAILSGSFGLLTTLHTGAFVMLTLTDLCQNTGLNAATLKAFQSAIQRFIFSYTDFSHLFSLPSNMPRESVTRA